jgi:hypothetical protein
MLACSSSNRRGAASNGLAGMSSATPRFRAVFEGGAASDSNSPKVHRRESCLASVHTKPVSPPRHAEFFFPFFISATEFLYLASASPRSVCVQVQRDLPFVLEERLSYLAYQLQVLSPTTRLLSRHQLNHVLQGGIPAIPLPSLPNPYFFVHMCLSDDVTFQFLQPHLARDECRTALYVFEESLGSLG